MKENRTPDSRAEYAMPDVIDPASGTEHGDALKEADSLSLDELLAQVEHCVKQLEDPQIPLEDAFRCYEEGVRRLKMCSGRVAQIEQKMQVINSRGELEDF